MISRRTFLKRTAQTSIAAVAAAKLGLSDSSLFAQGHPLQLQELHIPPVITGGDIFLAPGTAEIYPGTNTNLLLINNSFPGPTIKLKKGETFSASIHNNLGEDSVLHWHGIHAPSKMSGHPIDVVASGLSYSVDFPIIQKACTTFYHAHPHMSTGRQVYMGIGGLFIVEDDEEKNLGLPSGMYDVPLMIQDRRFDSNHQLIYAPGNVDLNSGWLGDTILVNGTPNALLSIAPTLYRLRLVNGSNSRFYKIAFSDNRSFTVIGNDGGFIDAPVVLNNAWLAPAERLDILVDFSSLAQGESVNLKSIKFSFTDLPGSESVRLGAEMNLMQLTVNKTGSSGGAIPAALPAIEKYNGNDAKRTRLWKVAAIHHINDANYDINAVNEHVPLGDLEEWIIESEAQNTHPMHVHGAQFQVLNRNGNPPEPTESGWKDIVRLDPLGIVNVLVKFSEYTGLFLIHCHKLEHADAGMMANFSVDLPGTVIEEKKNETELNIFPNPASEHALLTYAPLEKDTMLIISDERGSILIKEILSAGSDKFAIITSVFSTGNYQLILGERKANLIVMH
jgi:FtsP/CotA-like multicopper oxidase with cupredoxin domain